MKLSRYECPNCYQPLTKTAGPDKQNPIALSCMNFKCNSLACDIGGHGEDEAQAYIKLYNVHELQKMQEQMKL